MTYLEIYQNVKRLIPAGLREKYDHLSYGEMAGMAELSQGGGVALVGRAVGENRVAGRITPSSLSSSNQSVLGHLACWLNIE